MKKFVRALAACFAFIAAAPHALAEAPPAPQDEAAQKRAEAEFVSSLTKRNGVIKLASAKATLNVPAGLYFLDAKDARRVLEEAWGNPPDETVLGMILPQGKSPLDLNVWAATFTYLPDGYVSDSDAEKINYDSLLKDMQKGAREENAWRKQNGYPEVEIIAWADKPVYLAEEHKMYWAKELNFGGSETHTLNYDIRVLGRRGVLVVSFIGAMDQLATIKAAAPGVLKLASFDAGSRYADYVKGVDKTAAYGLAGLVAGGVIAKKTGILAAILIFGKKFIGLIIAGLVMLGARMRGMFGKKDDAAG